MAMQLNIHAYFLGYLTKEAAPGDVTPQKHSYNVPIEGRPVLTKTMLDLGYGSKEKADEAIRIANEHNAGKPNPLTNVSNYDDFLKQNPTINLVSPQQFPQHAKTLDKFTKDQRTYGSFRQYNRTLFTNGDPVVTGHELTHGMQDPAWASSQGNKVPPTDPTWSEEKYNADKAERGARLGVMKRMYTNITGNQVRNADDAEKMWWWAHEAAKRSPTLDEDMKRTAPYFDEDKKDVPGIVSTPNSNQGSVA